MRNFCGPHAGGVLKKSGGRGDFAHRDAPVFAQGLVAGGGGAGKSKHGPENLH